MSTPGKKPNLFAYATSELSQDAVICWLLEWAHPRNRGEVMHRAGKAFLQSLLKLFEGDGEKKVPVLDSHDWSIDVSPQDHYADVVAKITENGSDYCLLIEDKTETSEKGQGGKLTEYYNNQKSGKNTWGTEFKDKEILPIYFKTRLQSDFKNVTERGYKLYLLHDFLRVLNAAGENGASENLIFQQYREYLQSIANDYVQWESESITGIDEKNKCLPSWADSWWIGLFDKLQQELNRLCPSGSREWLWKITNNPREGSYPILVNWRYLDPGKRRLYIQLDKGLGTIRMSPCNDAGARDQREEAEGKLTKKAEHELGKGICIPLSRRKEGESCKIFQFRYLVAGKDSTQIDFGKTLQRIEAVCRMASEVQETLEPTPLG